MTSQDDLYVGQLVAVTGHRERFQSTPWSEPVERESRESVDGWPLRIIAISLPFICVDDGEDRFPLDLRQVMVQRVSKRYAEMVREGVRGKLPESTSVQGDCPVCGGGLSHVMSESDMQWTYTCRECGFRGVRK